MARDKIIEEVRRIRRRLAARYGYDVHALARALREKDARGKERVVSFVERRGVALPAKAKR